MALNVPMQTVQQPIVQSLSDAVAKWTDINNAQQQGQLAKQQEARLQSQNARENKLGDLQFGQHQRKAHNEVMTEFKTVLQKKAQAAGIQPNTPEYQQLANATYATGFDKIMQNTGAPPYKMGTNIDLSAVDALITPAEAHAQEMETETAKQDAMLKRQIQLGQFNNEYKDRADQRNYEQSVGLEDRRYGHDLEKAQLENTWKNDAKMEIDQAKRASGADLEKIPATHRMAYVENQTALNKIDNAIKLISANKDSFGLKNMLGENINQRLDPNGIEARAAVADIGGTKLHDLSGAAVSASESPRLMPLIPTVTDNAEAAIKKLNNLRKEYAGVNSQFETMYGNGEYKNPMKANQQEGAQVPSNKPPRPAEAGYKWFHNGKGDWVEVKQ